MKTDDVQIGFHVSSCIMSFRCLNNGSEGEKGRKRGDNHPENIPEKLNLDCIQPINRQPNTQHHQCFLIIQD